MKKTILSLTLLIVCHLAWGQTFELRLLNHWDNPNGTVERGYAGRSIWKWDEIPTKKTSMPQALKARYEEYGRINQQYGINGTVLNNVNAKPIALSTPMLLKTKKIADILRPYGIKVYLSVNFASPKALGDLSTADPLDPKVQQWWDKKVNEIYRLIPDFGGFLVKANSEGEPGPMDYGRTHVDGANMLASALQPHGGIVMWRAFVYSAKGGDRANQAYEEFIHFDGQFADNVIIQIKNGPIDFQPREAVSPLFFGLKKTKMMVEFQITQEYTGESVHTCFLAPMWREFFQTLGMVQNGSPVHPNLIGIAGVANIGDSPNWTANDLAMANWYAFGRLANDPTTPSEKIAEDFLRSYYSTNEPGFLRPMTQLLLKSREAVVDYMMPLGLHHIFAADHHYGPEPWCDRKGWREDWLPRFYHRADSIGLGFNRTDHGEPCLAGHAGSNNVGQYPEPLRTLYNNRETCPENLILWFHHVPWDYTMRNGLSLWDNLCYTYDRGVRQANDFVKTWESLRPICCEATGTAQPILTPERYEQQLRRFQRQAKDAQWWRDACLLYFQQFSRRPLPPDSPDFHYTLEQVMNYHLRMDNYTAADIDKLPE
jgi:alpha-glucuronidase